MTWVIVWGMQSFIHIWASASKCHICTIYHFWVYLIKISQFTIRTKLGMSCLGWTPIRFMYTKCYLYDVIKTKQTKASATLWLAWFQTELAPGRIAVEMRVLCKIIKKLLSISHSLHCQHDIWPPPIWSTF